MDRDEEEFANYWKFGMKERVHYHVGSDFKLEKEDILIIDESDDFIFKRPNEFQTWVGNKRSICFTATPIGDSKVVEKEVLKMLNLKMIYDHSNPFKKIEFDIRV